MATSAQRSINTIESFLQQIGGQIKSAEAHTEPGSIGGETGHPVKDVDDKTEAAQTGDRASENESDVKEDQGEAGVDSTPEAKAAAHVSRLLKGASTPKALTPGNQTGKKLLRKQAEGGAAATPGSAADDQLQIGTNKQPTGDDPANETGSAKGGKEDPGTDHPARTDNDALEGGKYAYDQSTPLEKIAADIKMLGDRICTRIYNSLEQPATGYGGRAGHGEKAAGDPVFGDAHLAYQAGDELAAILNGTLDKQAADRMVHRSLAEIIKTGSDDADRYAAYMFELANQEEQLRKAAEGEIPAEALMGGDMAGGGIPGGGGGMPPGAEMAADMAGGGTGGEEDPAAMLAALGGGEAAEEPMGEEEMEGDDDIDPEQLQQLLEQLGVSGDDVAGAAAEEEAAGGGLGEEELPPEAAPAGPKMAADRGRKKPKQARDSQAEFFKELIQRSRTR